MLEAQPAGMGFAKELRAHCPSTEKPYFVPIMDTRSQANFIIETIGNLIDEGRNLSEIAVLYRAHYHAMDLQMELTRRNIDYQITSGVRFFEQAHVKDFSAQLRFASNPSDVAAFARFACLLPKIGPKTAERIHTLARKLAEKESQNLCTVLNSEALLKKVPKDAQAEWPSLATTLQELADAIDKESPEQVVQLALDGWYPTFMRTLFPNWLERSDDLQSLLSFAARYETMQELLAQLVLLSTESNERGLDDQTLSAANYRASGQRTGIPHRFCDRTVRWAVSSSARLTMAMSPKSAVYFMWQHCAKEALYLTYPMLNQQVIHCNASMPAALFKKSQAITTKPFAPLRKELGELGGYLSDSTTPGPAVPSR